MLFWQDQEFSLIVSLIDNRHSQSCVEVIDSLLEQETWSPDVDVLPGRPRMTMRKSLVHPKEKLDVEKLSIVFMSSHWWDQQAVRYPTKRTSVWGGKSRQAIIHSGKKERIPHRAL